MLKETRLRMPKIGRTEVSMLILMVGILVIYLTPIEIWPWILFVLGATEIPMVYYHQRIHSSRLQVILWLMVLPVLISVDNIHPHRHIVDYGLIVLVSFTLILYVLRAKIDDLTVRTANPDQNDQEGQRGSSSSGDRHHRERRHRHSSSKKES